MKRLAFGMAVRAAMLVALLTLWLGAIIHAHAQTDRPPASDDPEELRVALFDAYLPIGGLNLAGEPSGLLVDLWHLWSERTGVPVRFVLGSFNETIEAVRSGRADVHAGLFRNDERAQWLSFSRTLYETTSSYHLWRANGLPEDLDRLGGRAIGVQRGTQLAAHVRAAPQRFRARVFDDLDAMLRALARGEVAAIFHESVSMQAHLTRAGVVGEVARLRQGAIRNAVHAGIPKDRADLRALVDYGFSLITQSEFDEAARRWIPGAAAPPSDRTNAALPLTDEERAWLDGREEIRIGVVESWPPVSARTNDGALIGMSPALMRLVDGQLGNRLRFVPGTWESLLQRVRDRELDAVIDITPTRERAADFNFTIPYLIIPHAIATRAPIAPINALTALDGRRVALERGFATVESVRAAAPDAEIVFAPDTAGALTAVADGTADAWVGNAAVFTYLQDREGDRLGSLRLGAPLPMPRSALGVGVRKDWGILRDILNKAIARIDPDEVRRVAEPWLAGRLNDQIDLSVAERRWLADHGDRPVRVLLSGWPPFDYIDAGEPAGIAVAHLRHVLDQLGLTAEFVEADWDQGYRALTRADGTIDLAPTVAPSPARAEQVALTQPYLAFPMVIVTRVEEGLVAGLDDLHGRRVSVEAGFIMEERLRRDHPGIDRLVYPDTHAALEAVSLGRADAYVGNLAAVSFHIQRQGLANLKIAAPSDYGDDVQAIGVRHDWPELAGMIDKVLARMTRAERDRLRTEAMSVRFEDGGQVRRLLLSGGAVLAVLVLLAGGVIWVNRRLARQVAERVRAERALTEKDRQLTAALENMSGGILMVDADGVVRVLNRKLMDLYDLPETIRPGSPLRDILAVRAARGDYGPGDPDRLIEARLSGYRTSGPQRLEDHVAGRIIEALRQPTADGGMVGIFNDITARARAERALAEQTDRLRSLSETLARYLSPQIYQAIFAGATDASVATARKKLTVFFSDIQGFTATTEEMEPEDMTFLLNDYLTKMSEIALDFGGTIDKYVGDAILIFFGDPETRGVREDALAAVRMAVAMQRRMVDLRAKWADMGHRHPFHVRMGINTGYCNVGNFGSDQRIDYTIIGGQVNLAARLEAICDPDGITLSHETYSLVRDVFDAEARPPIQVKGIREPVTPYAVTGILDAWDASERYIRKDIRGMRLWVDLMRMSEDQRRATIRELEDALDHLRRRDPAPMTVAPGDATPSEPIG